MIKLILGQLILFSTHLEFTMGSEETPVGNVGISQDVNRCKFRPGIDDVLLIACDPDRVGIDVGPRTPQQ